MGGSGARTIAVAAMHTGAPITFLGEIKNDMLGLIADGPDFVFPSGIYANAWNAVFSSRCDALGCGLDQSLQNTLKLLCFV
jgi:hypothetical protein